MFDETLAHVTALNVGGDLAGEEGLTEAFVQVCNFLYDNPDRLSWRVKSGPPSLQNPEGLEVLAQRYFAAYRRSDFPNMAGTIPDEMVSIVMEEVFGYSEEESTRIKSEHQRAMVAENCVGALLERYLDVKLRSSGWSWCCGSFVRAVDFVRKDQQGVWLALQIKNRDNSENSSSSAIRSGTFIEKWFRSFSKTGLTNWKNLPPLMQGYTMSEQDFTVFVRSYLRLNNPRRNKS